MWCLLGVRLGSISAQTTISMEELQKDFAIMKEAYTKLHPGLYRYTDSATIEGHFDDLEQSLMTDLSRKEVYLIFSRFLEKIKCGHTYANFWNQPDTIQQELFAQADKLPFTFQIVDKRIIITKNASEREEIPLGTEILGINDMWVSSMLDTLIQYVKSDGSNDGKRLDDLQVTGYGEFESFDIYFPLLYEPINSTYSLELKYPRELQTQSVTVTSITREKRKQVLAQRYGPLPESYDDLWKFKLMDPSTAYLKLGTFVTWKMEMDWKKFLKQAFRQIDENNTENLILDIRGNEGGMSEVNLELAKYLLRSPITLDATRELLRYEKVPEELNPYLGTWDDSFRDRTGKVTYIGEGFYTWKNSSNKGQVIKQGNDPFSGQVYLLMGPANSSATFLLSRILKEHNIATLVGQESGGNLKGTNGGQIFFLTLPHSKIEMDIPLIGYYPISDQPDRGIMPDVYVAPNVSDIVNGIDTELEVAKKLIEEGTLNKRGN